MKIDYHFLKNNAFKISETNIFKISYDFQNLRVTPGLKEPSTNLTNKYLGKIRAGNEK